MTTNIGHLTRRDVLATLLTATVFILYAVCLAEAAPVSGNLARGLSVVALGLGVGACAIGAVKEERRSPAAQAATVLGPSALIAFVITVVAGSPVTLAVLMAAIGLMWLTTTVQHAVGSFTTTTAHKTG